MILFAETSTLTTYKYFFTETYVTSFLENCTRVLNYDIATATLGVAYREIILSKTSVVIGNAFINKNYQANNYLIPQAIYTLNIYQEPT